MAAHLDLIHLRRHALPAHFMADADRPTEVSDVSGCLLDVAPRPRLLATWRFDAGGRRGGAAADVPAVPAQLRAIRAGWRMPPLGELAAPKLSLSKRVWMGVLRAYLVAAVGLVAFKVFQVATGQ